MDKTALVGDSAIASHKDVISDRLSENLDLEHVGNDLLRLAINVWVHKRDVIVACDDVTERREPLLYYLDRDGVRQRVPEVLELLVGGGRWDKQAMTVA